MAIIELPAPDANGSSSDCDNRPVSIDIIAVHGLSGDSKTTWTEARTGVLWLRDLLPVRDLHARVLTYDYDSTSLLSAGNASADRILPFANSLVAEICAERQLTNAFQRPIIFICHGFGGVLVKRALAFSATRRASGVEHLRSLYISTYAILFLGTPHEGLREDGCRVQQDYSQGIQTSSRFIFNLLRGSEMLQEITDQFAPLMKRFVIFNFWEQKKTLSGSTAFYIVEEDSAAPLWDNVERCGLATTYSELVKFSSNSDNNYKIILAALSRYIAAAPNLIRHRWINDIEALQQERQIQVEDLLRPRLLSITSQDSESDRNTWFMVPRCSSTYFTGRRRVANSVKKSLGPITHLTEANKHRICVIFGLGGSGKTQFCLRYAEENKSRYWGIFWIDASSEDNARADFALLGQRMGKGTSFSAGLHWFSECTQPWLLIIDNADDPDMDVSSFFPVGSSGHILITTRNPGAELYATAGKYHFSGMDPEDAVNLLLKTAFSAGQPPSPKVANRKIAQEIASELGYLALALTNAGTTIRRNIYTLEMYLRHYLGHRRDMMITRNISSASDGNIIATWEIPFQRIASQKTDPYRDAVNLIHICAFMHFDSLPQAVFRKLWGDVEIEQRFLGNGSNPRFSQSSLTKTFRLHEALTILYKYSIIEHDQEREVISLHPVVQRWARDRLSNEDRKRWLDIAVSVLANCISPFMEASGRQFRRQLLPHIESCLRELNALYGFTGPQTIRRSVELEHFVLVLTENGIMKRARVYQLDILKFREKTLGRTHQKTIQARSHLAYINFVLFDIHASIQTQYDLLKIHWRSRQGAFEWMIWPPWEPEHIPYCRTLSDLSSSLWFAQKIPLAQRAGERAVTGLRKRLGEDDPVTITAMLNLARIYLSSREIRKSRALLIKVIRKRKHFFGLNHPDTLEARNELGSMLCVTRENLPVAESIVGNVHKARKRVLGEEHIYCLWSMIDLARIKTARKRPEEAAKLLESILPTIRRTLGEEHPGMVMAKGALIQAYTQMERILEADSLLDEISRDIPQDSADYLVSKIGRIFIRQKLGRLQEVDRDCREVLEILKKGSIHARDSPRHLAVVEQLGRLYTQQERWSDLEALKTEYPAMKLSEGEGFNIWMG